MKKTGFASAATVIALNSFKYDLIASESGYCPLEERLTLMRVRVRGIDRGGNISATGQGSTVAIAHQEAMKKLCQELKDGLVDKAILDTSYIGANPEEINSWVCPTAAITSETTRVPEIEEMPMPEMDPPHQDPETAEWIVTIVVPVQAEGQSVITTRFIYGSCPPNP